MIAAHPSILEVLGARAEGRLEYRGVANEQAPRLIRLKQPLVRIQGNAVRELDSVQSGPALLGEHGEAAVRRIDVHPEPLLLAEST